MLPRGSRVCLLQDGDHPGELPEEGAGARVHPHDAGWGGRHPQWVHHPATWVYRELCIAMKVPLMYSFSGNSAASAPISTFMCLWAFYTVPGLVYIFPPAEYAGWLWEYIIRSQTHECGNWDWDPDIPFLGILVSKFRYFVLAVWQENILFPLHRKQFSIYMFSKKI